MAGSLQDIIDQMAEAGITGLSASDLRTDGTKVTFRPSDQKKKKSAWCRIYEHQTRSGQTFYSGVFGDKDWHEKIRFTSEGLSIEERAERDRQRKEAEKAVAKARKSEAEKAAEKAAKLWATAREEGNSPYLERKQVRPFGLRFLRDTMLVPVRDVTGKLSGCQYVTPDGAKIFNTGMEKVGRFHALGDLSNAETIAFGEGYATCASGHMATRWPTVVCFDSGNIEPVIAALRPLYPKARFVILGDDDRHLRRRLRERLERLEIPGKVEPDDVERVFMRPEGEIRVRAWFEAWHGSKRIGFSVQRAGAPSRTWFLENAGRVSATLAAKKHDAIAVFPSFAADDSGGTDFNDLHLAEGLGVVRSQILNAIAAHDEAIKRSADKQRQGATSPAQPLSVGGLGGGWKDRLLVRKGEIASCLANVCEILLNDPAWNGVLAYNEFSLRIEKRKALPTGNSSLGIWGDADDVGTVLWLTQQYGLTPKPADVAQAAEYVAKQRPYHPVREWLRGLRWDGVPRLESWVSDYLDVPRTEYTTLVGKWFLLGMVARVMRPGAKFDYCLVLEGTQGKGKSTLLSILGGVWYSDQELDLRNKDAMASLPGVWLQEFSELGALTRQESHQQKSFLSRTDDRFRPTYARHVQTVPRQTVFSGSTNDWEWNKDPTGGRRFWPVEVGSAIDHANLILNREQLFAEAVHLYDAGERFHPDQDQQRTIFDPEQLKRETQDSLVDVIVAWVEKQPYNKEFSKADVMLDGLKLDPSKMTRDLDTRVGIALKKLGCKRVERRTNPVARYWYLPPARTAPEASSSVEAVEAPQPAQPFIAEADYVSF